MSQKAKPVMQPIVTQRDVRWVGYIDAAGKQRLLRCIGRITPAKAQPGDATKSNRRVA